MICKKLEPKFHSRLVRDWAEHFPDKLDLNVSEMLKVRPDISFVINKASKRSHHDEAKFGRKKSLKTNAFFRSLNPLLWQKKISGTKLEYKLK